MPNNLFDINNIEPDFDYISLTDATYSIIELHMKSKGVKIAHWADMKNEMLAIYVLVTKQIVEGNLLTPKDIHSMWKKLMIEKGWKYSDYINVVTKRHLAIAEWEKISEFRKEEFQLYLSIVNGMKEFFMEV